MTDPNLLPSLAGLSVDSGTNGLSPLRPFGPPTPAAEPATSDPLIQQIMPLAGLALWEAWSGSLELVRFEMGAGARTPFQLDPAQIQPGVRWSESIYPPDRPKLISFLEAADSVRSGRAVDYRVIVGEGELLWVRHWLLARSALQAGRRHLRGLLMAIPEQKHLEWECLRVSERECNRIGQELHDDLCQVLAGVNFMMRVIGQRAAKSGTPFTSEFQELNDELLGATNRVRSMAHGLFPARLNHSTLRQALKDFARQTKTRFALSLTLDLPRQLAPHTPEQVIHIYRIAQEAVSNSVRHGKATALRLALAEVGEHFQVFIEDNGSGFPVTMARPEGIGMHVMQYRARMLGGELRFSNCSPVGARVELTYPRSRPAPRRRPRKTFPS